MPAVCQNSWEPPHSAELRPNSCASEETAMQYETPPESLSSGWDVGRTSFVQNGGCSLVKLECLGGASEVLLQPGISHTVSLEWKNITFSVPAKKGKKVITNRMYGRVTPGSLTAIMGPSGAGKTTLMNILSGHYDKGYDGEVHVNGCVRDTELFNKQSCYVMQDDCLLPELTVRESLTMSVQLRMPSLGDDKRQQLVTDAIVRWGLEDCENTRASAISGGQRKRLAISQELISNPPVIFLDEPTSGLDSSSALRCVSVMKSLAGSGHTVLSSIHNPSAKLFSYFDRLYMISEGMCIYNGPVEKLLHFLNAQGLHCPIQHNPADFITEIASGEYGNLNKQLAKSFTPAEGEDGAKTFYHHPLLSSYGGKIMTSQEKADLAKLYEIEVNYFHQFMVLLRRCFLCVIRNRIATTLRCGAYVFFAVLLTVLYYDVGNDATRVMNNAAMLLLMVSVILFQSIMPTVLIFPTEMRVLLRENRNCWYSPGMYYFARILTELPFSVCGPLVLTSVLYWTTSQPPEFFRAATLVLFAVQVCSTTQSLALIVSASSGPQTALFLALPAASPSFLFCGFFVQFHHIHAAFSWITYTSHVYHAHQGMLLAIYGHGREELWCEENSFCFYADPGVILGELGAQEAYVWTKFFILLGMDTLYKLVAFLILKWRLKMKH